MPIADIVPRGIALLGFFNSPDKFAPAIIPVTAGKNTANTCQKSVSSKFPIINFVLTASTGESKNETTDNPIIPKIKYCKRIANTVLTYEMVSNISQAIIDIRTGECIGNIMSQPSVNPAMYNAADNV